MTLGRLRLRNLLYHWRGNLAVLLGVVVGAAVLTGALLVGDSLRGSLAELALRQLDWVEDALIAPRFFRTALGDELLADGAAARLCPAIVLQATAGVQTSGTRASRHARGVSVLGVDGRFWPPQEAREFAAQSGRPEFVWLNSTLARDLGVKAGDQISLRLQKPSAVPRESILGRHDDASSIEDWPLAVARVLTAEQREDAFSLRPGVEAPRTAFIPLEALQGKLGIGQRCNALLAAGATSSLGERLRERLDLEDWGLVLRSPQERVAALFQKLDRNHDGLLQPREWRNQLAEALVHAIDPAPAATLSRAKVDEFYRKNRNYLSLESRNLLLDPAVEEAAMQAAAAAGLRSAPTLVYLANTIAAGNAEIPYSVVAALDPTLPPPLGPFLPKGIPSLADDQIVLADWKESPLPRDVNEAITLKYYPPVHHGDLREEKATFRLAGFMPLSGVSGDPDLTPEFPGITDKLSIDQWDPPFPYDNRRIKPADEHYWKEYRTTPKAYVTLAAGQRLWASRFGRVTSLRLASPGGGDLAALETTFRRELLSRLQPQSGGFVFQPIRQNALRAAGGGTDFGPLFLGFSFFLIAAALLLVGLLFRLNLDRRASEVGVLAAVGYRKSTLMGLLLGEGGVLAAAGAVIGTGVAVLYAGLLLQLLDALWPGGSLASFLRPHYTAISLVIGAVGALVVSVLTIAWAVRSQGRVPPRALLTGQTEAAVNPGKPIYSRKGWVICAVALLGAVVLLACSASVQDQEMRAMTFFGSGSLLLTASLAAVSGWMRGARHHTVEGRGWWSIARLGIRNAARHPGRSLLTAGLLAAAAFLLVAVEAFRRSAGEGAGGATAANGGCALVAESDLPLFLDLNTDEGRRQLLDKLLPAFRDELNGDNAAAQERVKAAGELLQQVTVFAFRVHAGDDASCLNLYQPLQPRILGVPDSLIISDRRFNFAAVQAETDAERANPWKILQRDSDGPVPAFGEKNTVEWMLKSGLGGVLEVPGGQVRIAGLLQDSVFQSSLLISERVFLRLYPGHEGYSSFLITTPPGREGEVKRLLDTAVAGRGFEATPVEQRLESYLAVENTYLSTFQALGGLGLVLGSLGLAVVLLRGVWERRAELALLRALGYRRGTLGFMVLSENGFLLLLGLTAGTASALAAVAPHLAGGGLPWRGLLGLLAAVLAVGLGAGALATAATLRAPLVPALRRE
jgi:ABC-type lipoprotein release transport system permease subunit